MSTNSKRLALVSAIGLLFGLVWLGGRETAPSTPRDAARERATREPTQSQGMSTPDARLADRSVDAKPIVSFDATGATLRAADDAWRVRVSMRGMGRSGEMETLAPTEPVAVDDRIRYPRRGSAEWFRETPRGLEHGAVVERKPSGEGVLELRVGFEGLDPVLVGSEVELHDGAHAPRLAYRDLVVNDARGDRLPAAMAVVDRDVVLRIDDARATYPIVIDPFVTTQIAKVTASDGVADDEFGGTPYESSGGPSVAIDGNVAVVAASYKGGANGAVYVFTRSGSSWTQLQAITPPAAIGSNARFGYSVGISGDTIVVGAPFTSTGAAAVYVLSGGTYALQQVLTASGALAGEQFGCSVAISGNSVAIGARYDDRNTAGGAAYVFTRSGTTWSQQQRLKGSDQAASDDFGTSVSIDADTLVVGAIFKPANAPTGAAYVYTRSGSTWSFQQKLVASDAASLDQFSRSISLLGNRVVIGAPQNQVTLYNQGAAYVFDRTGSTWSQTARLLASDAASDDQFGYAVALGAGWTAVGARLDDAAAANAGSVYTYRASGASWVDEKLTTATDAVAGDRYGDSVGLSGVSLVVGAPFRDDRGTNSGAAYFVDVLLSTGTPCTAGTQCQTGACVDGVCCATSCGGGSTSDCQACSVAAGGTTDGTCTALTAPIASTVVCRASTGACDVADSCVAGQTACPDAKAPNGTSCPSDGVACNGAEACSAGSCTSQGLTCDDANACTSNTCAEPGGCAYPPISCDDANACTADSCSPATGCTHAAISCDDGNACTADSCSPVAGCLHVAISCDDSDACTADSCDAATGCGHAAVSCDDSDACTADACDPATGCSHTAVAGCCLSAAQCDDGDPCTTDSCNGSNACEHVANPSCSVDAGTADGGAMTDAGLDLDASVGDAGSQGDAGGDGGEDGGSAVDGGKGGVSGSGCGCLVAGGSPGTDLPLTGVLLLLGLVIARHGRRRR